MPTRQCAVLPTTPSSPLGRQGRSPRRCGNERDQGRGKRRQPPSKLDVAARCVALREQREQGHIRSHAVGGDCVAALTSVGGCRSRRSCTATPPSAGCPGGISSHRCRWPQATSPGIKGLAIVRSAFGEFSPGLGGLVDRAVNEQWIDAEPRDGKQGGAFCMPFGGDRSLVMLNWSGSAESAQTTAHELGHAYHNTTLAGRTALQRRLPMALAETAGIFCETLVVEAGLARLDGDERLALLDIGLQGTNQVVVDIHSRFLFETEVFARRQRRTLSAGELSEMMTEAQLAAFGNGIDQSTAHPYMWLLKPHYYGSHFYNWPYTYGLLFGLGLFARYQDDPERFRDPGTTHCCRVPAWTPPRNSARRSPST